MSKRQCAFTGCDSVAGAQRLYAFPAHEPDVCRIWVHRSGNPELAGLTLESLTRKYVCEKHFSPSSFKSSSRRYLFANTKPIYAAGGQLLEDMDELAEEQLLPKLKQKAHLCTFEKKQLLVREQRHIKTEEENLLPTPALSEQASLILDKAENKLRLTSKTPKTSEDTTYTVTSPECMPIPAGTMLRKINSGNTSDVCSLCLCEDGKLLRSTTVYLKDDYTEGNFSLASLVRELQLDKIIAQNSLDRLCELCVQQLSLFYLFKSKCTILSSGLTNFYKFSESRKHDKYVVFPFATIPEYAVKSEDFSKKCLDADDRSNLGTMFVHAFLNNKQYSSSDGVPYGKPSATENNRKYEFTQQSELIKYSTVIKCIVQGKSYCSCCLTENQALLEVHETMLFMKGQNEIVPLKDILFGIICNKTTGCLPVLICQDCLNITINAYNFKTMFDKSTTIIQNCIDCFETFLTNSENTALPDEVTSIYLNFYEQFCDFIISMYNQNEFTSLGTKGLNPKTNQDQSEVPVTDRSGAKREELTSACHICGHEFHSFNEVQPHISAEHIDLLYCHYCNRDYKSKEKWLLINHIAKCQTLETPYECDLCDMKFTKRNLIEAHRLRHFPKTIKCDYCPVMFWKQKDFNNHNLRTHRELLQPRYECSICHSSFSKRTEMREHKATHPADSMHTCKYCGASYMKKSGYYAHSCAGKVMSLKTTNGIENEHNSNIKCDVQTIKYNDSHSTICDICGVVLKSHKQIEIHRKKHQEIKENPDSDTIQDKSVCKTAMCELCGRLFRDMRSVDRHVKNYCKITTGKQCLSGPNGIQKKRIRKTIECQHCNYKTQLKMCLERHMNKHHLKIKPHKCSVCENSFYTMNALRAHKQIHTDRDSLKCNVCGDIFKYKICLMMHMRLHTGERPYPCDLCDEKFVSASRRQDHRTRQHFEPTVQCNICLKFYYNQRSLREHLRNCHSEKPKKTSYKMKQRSD